MAFNFCFGTSGEEQILPSTLRVKVDWENKGQTIEGFGVFAGRENAFFESKYREKIMESLFSTDGLGLTIFRGQIYPNFNSLKQKFLENEDETRASAQLDLFKEAKKKYNINKFVLSSWSPPYNWKTIKGIPFGRVGSSFNQLSHSKYSDFAHYIVSYIEFFRNQGIDIYSISAQNEPEFPTTGWEGCVWWPSALGNFLTKLKPLLEERGFSDVKIMVGETANWNIADFFVFMMRLFMKNSYKTVDIVASHGYSLPQFSDLLVTFETNPRPWFLNYDYNKPIWITEASSTYSYDGNMKTAINLAVSLHHFIANNHVSAYIFWLAMIDKYSNEALIFEDKDQDLLVYPKVFYVYGQFTKWIKPGFVRYSLKKNFFDFDFSGTLASLYLNEKTSEFVLIVINPHKYKNSMLKLDFNGARIKNEKELVGFKTNEESNWELMTENEFILTNDGLHLTLINENYSVKTISGKLFFDN